MARYDHQDHAARHDADDRDLQRQIEEIARGEEGSPGQGVEAEPDRRHDQQHGEQPGIEPGRHRHFVRNDPRA